MSKLLPVSLLTVLVAALLSGCGGQNVSADEVPGPPVALKVPVVAKGGSDALAGNSSSASDDEDSQDSSATPTPTATAESGSTGTTQSGSTGGTSGTTQQQPTQQDEGTNEQSQDGGGDTFDDFCKNNPGAC